MNGARVRSQQAKAHPALPRGGGPQQTAAGCGVGPNSAGRGSGTAQEQTFPCCREEPILPSSSGCPVQDIPSSKNGSARRELRINDSQEGNPAETGLAQDRGSA